MLSIPQIFTGGLLFYVAMAIQVQGPHLCGLASCVCSTHVYPTSRSHNRGPAFDVTCYVTSLRRLVHNGVISSPDVTSLKLICTDFLTDNYLNSQFFRLLPGLLELVLENCNSLTVTSDALISLAELQSLEIKRCQFLELPKKVFDYSARLTRLTLSQCDLQTLPRLCSLLHLEVLNVSGQRLVSVDDCLADCGQDVSFSNLTVLDVSNNSLTELPNNFMSRSAKLRELYVHHNSITELSITECARLEVLDASGQDLQRVDFVTDGRPYNLRVLKLYGNGSRLFPLANLIELSNLTLLHAQHLSVDDSFWELLPSFKNLRGLALPVNNLTVLNLTDNVQLTHLNLSRNWIQGISASTFDANRGLQEIDLSWNSITKLMEDVFVNMTSLKILHLERNRIEIVLQSTFKNVSNLQQLVLANNSLRSIPLFFLRQLTSLRLLDLDYNSIGYLPYLTNAVELVVLKAAYNKIGSLLPRGFSNVPKLEYLYLPGNRIRTLHPGMFLNAPSLTALNLRENNIANIESFGAHPGLLAINLENNKIQDATFVFLAMQRLHSLFLDHNYLRRLSSDIFPPSLRIVSLTWNPIVDIEPGVFNGLPRLIHANLAACYTLWSLRLSMIEISPRLQPKPRMTVGPNAFDCDCRMADLKAWTQSVNSGQQGVDILNSTMPELNKLDIVGCYTHFTGKNQEYFTKVPLRDFVCPYQEPVCEEGCLCCAADQLDPHQVSLPSNCSCQLNCPTDCACFHGGSRYAKFFTHIFCNYRNLTEIPDSVPVRTTHLHMDGNNLTSVSAAELGRFTDVVWLFLNGSSLENMEPGCFRGLDNLERLNLGFNSIRRIDENAFGEMKSLKELELQHNRIHFVHHAAFYMLKALEKLDLSNNLLKTVAMFDYLPPSASLSLSFNSWSCDCRFMDTFVRFLVGHRDKVKDFDQLRCFWYDKQPVNLITSQTDVASKDSNRNVTFKPEPESVTDGNENIFPSSLISAFDFDFYCIGNISHHNKLRIRARRAGPFGVMVAVTISVVMVVVVCVVLGVVCVRYRSVIRALLFVKLGVRLWDPNTRLDRQDIVSGMGECNDADDDDKEYGQIEATATRRKKVHTRLYDAFVSYSHQDEQFVVSQLVPKLEHQGPRPYRLCVHYRDFPVGDAIADTIVASVQKSQRTLMLLSNNFLLSEWCRFEFRTAHQHMLQEGHRLIIVLMHGVPEDRLDADLKMALKTHTYLSIQDPWFWEKLYFAMPHEPCRSIDDQPRQRTSASPSSHSTDV